VDQTGFSRTDEYGNHFALRRRGQLTRFAEQLSRYVPQAALGELGHDPNALLMAVRVARCDHLGVGIN
jgi:hypothetical protein